MTLSHYVCQNYPRSGERHRVRDWIDDVQPTCTNWCGDYRARLPALAYIAEEVPHGLLLSCGQDLPDFSRRAVTYVDKILKRAKPADLPVAQPLKFKLVLNLKTAKLLGLTFPQTPLLTADEVIG